MNRQSTTDNPLTQRTDSYFMTTAKKATKKTRAIAKAAKTKTAKTAKAKGPATESKAASVINMLRTKDGATVADIAAATKWQSHTVRGFIAGTVRKKMQLNVTTTRN